jgi:hypothetical protein
MTTLALRWATATLLLGLLPGQQLQWQVPASGPATTQYLWMGPFADYNHDGYRDFVRLVDAGLYGYTHIASGLDGSTLWVDPNIRVAAPAVHAGDMDGDGEPDMAGIRLVFGTNVLEVFSPSRGTVFWQASGSANSGYGSELLGDLDVDGDTRPDVITITRSQAAADVYVYDHWGTLLYMVPCLAIGRSPVSLCKLGDRDGDGCDDFVVACLDPTGRGVQWLISGKNGSTIRETYGLLPGDATVRHVSNLGDIDGDDVPDYAAFPWYSSQRLIAVAYSGATGAVIRSWADYANSVVTGEDFDQDGVNDIVTGADWGVLPPNLWGRTYCWSGRDGSELWRVDVVPVPQGGNGSSGWMNWSASLGVQPGNPYPVVAWLDINWWTTTTTRGRTRAFGGTRIAQGPVTGTACTSSGTTPLIGVRALTSGSRITVAKTHANALAALNFAFSALPTPVDLTAFGFTGCTVYLDPAASALTLTGTTGIDRGYAAIDLPHPLAASAVGTNIVAQWLVYDPATLAYAATQMHALKLQ